MIKMYTLILSIFIISGTQASTGGMKDEDISKRVVAGGYKNPGEFDSPKRLGQHQEAIVWLKGLTSEKLIALANDFQQKTGQGRPIDVEAKAAELKQGATNVLNSQDVQPLLNVAVLFFGAKKVNKALGEEKLDKFFGKASKKLSESEFSIAITNYEEILKKTLARGFSGISNESVWKESSGIMRGSIQKFNVHIVNLVAAYINLLDTLAMNQNNAAVKGAAKQTTSDPLDEVIDLGDGWFQFIDPDLLIPQYVSPDGRVYDRDPRLHNNNNL